MHWIKKIFAGLARMVLGLVVALVLAEVTLRVVGWSAPLFRQDDPELGWGFKPGLSGFNFKERKNFIRINLAGFNDREQEIVKKPGEFRIAVLGDSFTAAFEVPRESNFVARLENNLHATGRTNASVLNFGVTGYGTVQQLLLLRRMLGEYDPDVVLLMFFVGNDVSDNHPELAESIPNLRPYMVLTNGLLERWPGYPDPLALKKDQAQSERVNSLRLLQLLKQLWLGINDRKNASTPAVAGVPSEIYAEPTTEAWSVAWAVTEAALTEMHREVTLRGKRFLVFVIPEGETIISRDRTEWSYPEKRLVQWAQAQDVELTLLSSEFNNPPINQHPALYGWGSFLGRGHWNENGHAVVGEYLAEYLGNLKPET